LAHLLSSYGLSGFCVYDGSGSLVTGVPLQASGCAQSVSPTFKSVNPVAPYFPTIKESYLIRISGRSRDLHHCDWWTLTRFPRSRIGTTKISRCRLDSNSKEDQELAMEPKGRQVIKIDDPKAAVQVVCCWIHDSGQPSVSPCMMLDEVTDATANTCSYA